MNNAPKNCVRFILSLKCKYPTKNNINVSKPAITTRILPNDFFVEIVYIQNKLPMKKNKPAIAACISLELLYTSNSGMYMCDIPNSSNDIAPIANENVMAVVK